MDTPSVSHKGPGIIIDSELFERAALACRSSAFALQRTISVRLALDWDADAASIIQALDPAPHLTGLSSKDHAVLDLVRQEVMTQASYEHCVRTLARQRRPDSTLNTPSSPLTVAAAIRGGSIDQQVLQHPSWVLPYIEFHDPRAVHLLAQHVGCNALLLSQLGAPDRNIQEAVDAARAALAH